MVTLRFDENKCLDCESRDCLTKCQYLDMGADEAGVEIQQLINGENARVLHECRTCYAC